MNPDELKSFFRVHKIQLTLLEPSSDTVDTTYWTAIQTATDTANDFLGQFPDSTAQMSYRDTGKPIAFQV